MEKTIKEFENEVKQLARDFFKNTGAKILRIEINVEPYHSSVETNLIFREHFDEQTSDL